MDDARDLNGAFNCDHQVEKQIDKLFKLFNIKCCLETGTYTGNTCIWFYKKVDGWYNWAAKRYDLQILTQEEKLIKKFPMLVAKINKLEDQLAKQKLEIVKLKGRK